MTYIDPDTGLETEAQPGSTAYNEKALLNVFKLIGLTFVAAAPISLITLTSVSFGQRIWIAFLLANLAIWTGVVAVVGVKAIAKATRLISLTTARVRMAHREQRRVALAAE